MFTIKPLRQNSSFASMAKSYKINSHKSELGLFGIAYPGDRRYKNIIFSGTCGATNT